MIRPSLALLALGSVSLGCTAAEPRPALAVDEVAAMEPDEYRGHGPARPPEAPSKCPPGAERLEQDGEEPGATRWWCVRGEVRHGPFYEQDFDDRSRTWYDIRGEYEDGELHGNVDHEGFYEVGYSGSRRVFVREVYEHGRLVHSNEAELDAVLDADHPTVVHRFMVRASGFRPFVPRGGEENSFGTFDVEVSTDWVDGPLDATPSVLRVEVSMPERDPPARADGLLYAPRDEDLPRLASDLSFGDLPLASAPWARCDPPGCQFPVEVTLRWLVPGPGRLKAHLTTRAVPETWPMMARVEVKVEDP